MINRPLGPFSVSAIGLGCMNLSHAYAVPPAPAAAAELLLRALDLGITHFDTATLYGFGANEELVGRVLSPHRSKFTLASKCGIHGVAANGQIKRVIDGRPETLKSSCEESLKRLRTDVIDLYYLHRWDKKVPIEESVGALAALVDAGKIRTIGLCEVSAGTLRRAAAVHRIAAVQSEYSLCTRNPEIAVLDACRGIGASFVAFCPLGRGFLAGALRDVSGLAAKDIRRAMPRFEPANHALNLRVQREYEDIAREAGCRPSQLALAWVLARGPHVLAIPGTTSIAHLQENACAPAAAPPETLMQRLDDLFGPAALAGDRYNTATQAEIDTECFEPASPAP
ncbi:MAG: aldo/keto reductase [Steroidobacteraceae bacterium]|jgi:aryl-alcohol dehydrogenase-like predicted oxidoreductase